VYKQSDTIVLVLLTFAVYTMLYKLLVVFTARYYAERSYATVCRLSIRPSVRDVQVPWSHRLVLPVIARLSCFILLTDTVQCIVKCSQPAVLHCSPSWTSHEMKLKIV